MGLILMAKVIEVNDWTQVKEYVHTFRKYLINQPHSTSSPQQQKLEENQNSHANFKVFYTDCTPQSRPYYQSDYTQHCVIVTGSEANGISSDAHNLSKELQAEYIHIPMSSQVESLNAAVAGSIVLSEVQRQRSLMN